MTTFEYRCTHLASGKVIVNVRDFANRKEFLAALAKWNLLSCGLWRYEEIKEDDSSSGKED
jgi:hypothetical protein